MDEKEYLLMRSVHAKIDDVITEQQNLNPGQIWVARQPAFDGATSPDDVIEDEDEESGIFCMSNVSVFQKTDPTVSLSYWIGQLLSQKMLAGKGSFKGLFTTLPLPLCAHSRFMIIWNVATTFNCDPQSQVLAAQK